MKLCKYQYYKEGDSTSFPRLYCKVDNGYCIYAKKCLKVQKFIPMEDINEKECYKYNMGEAKNLPQDAYLVQSYRPNGRGCLYLYVVINDRIEKILTNLTEINQNYVYLKEDLDGYQVSLTPFAKTTTAKKKTTKK